MINKKLIFLPFFLILISCGAGISDYSENLPGGYQFVSESSENQIIQGNFKLIPCTIISYQYDDEFILVAQKPFERCIANPDPPINNVSPIQFWIINIKQDSMHGPMTINNYLEKRIELHIPENLVLNISI